MLGLEGRRNPSLRVNLASLKPYQLEERDSEHQGGMEDGYFIYNGAAHDQCHIS